MSFKNLNLINPIVRAATEAGCPMPTELQTRIIPQILNGKDILCCIPRGTERLTSFTMPILQALKKNNPDHNDTRVLVLTPTKETALQIEENFKIYTKYLPLSQLSVYEGISNGTQLSSLRRRLDVLVATPQKLLELDDQRHISLSKVEVLIIDDIEILLENNTHELKRLIGKLPLKRQNILFSAVISQEVSTFADKIFDDGMEIKKTTVYSAVS
ncbi:DEAD/DEAH box helicase [Chryseobacterium chendengshani]|uniref:DEAD/DEAH box helicase n=1 Tax=unclassified Chryseobacterium TaxID=2593645 RepID=UPI001C640DF7|nr:MULTISPECIES: DEAD/DEAH box helicase [unclassified Chryseobacterium]MBW7676329.1 DEAD/DEAH box helicase [Chryseobacterium sp. LJ756]MBW8523701.1 DEAD/DEAH box helicase [Chryseobacterium sp. LJ668]QYK16645.1 DEAD/DEAH box helicase [Chryseobacterium sp. LJ668]